MRPTASAWSGATSRTCLPGQTEGFRDASVRGQQLATRLSLKSSELYDVFANGLRASSENCIVTDVNLAASGVENCGHCLSSNAVGHGNGFQHRDRGQRLLQYLAQALHRRQPYAQAGKRTRTGDHGKSLHIALAEPILLEQQRNYRNQAGGIRAAFYGHELQSVAAFVIATAQGNAAVTARGIDGKDEHGWAFHQRKNAGILLYPFGRIFHQFQQHAAGAGGVHKDVQVPARADLDFVGDKASAAGFQALDGGGKVIDM